MMMDGFPPIYELQVGLSKGEIETVEALQTVQTPLGTVWMIYIYILYIHRLYTYYCVHLMVLNGNYGNSFRLLRLFPGSVFLKMP